MAIKDNFSVDNMSQEIDLGEILGRAPTQNEIAAFQEEAIEKIIERTQSSKDIDGNGFTKYSPAYAEEKGSDKVDLTLMGDMLLSVEARNRGGVIELFINDSDKKVNIKKGYNHNEGDTVPQRKWFGLNVKEADEIAKRIKEETPTSVSDAISAAAIFQESRELNIDEILRNIGLFVD